MESDKNTLYCVLVKEFQSPDYENKEKFAVSNSLDRLMYFIKVVNKKNTPIKFYEFSDVRTITCSEDSYHYFLSKMEKGIYNGSLSTYNMLMYMSRLV